MKNINKKITRFAVIAAISATMMGCNGGGSDGGSDSSTLQGRFKDSNVDGLEYTGNNRSGITFNGGRFNYEKGDTVTFSIGNIELGSALGSSLITPSDLGKTENKTIKIAQLLQSLDSVGTLNDGITIDGKVREIFNLNHNTLNNDFDDLLVSANSNNGDSVAYSKVSKDSAEQHLLGTLGCAYSGGFIGIEKSGTGSFDVFSPSGSTKTVTFWINRNLSGRNLSNFLTFEEDVAGALSIKGAPDTFTVDTKPIWIYRGITYTFDNLNNLIGYDGSSNIITKKIKFKRLGGDIDATHRFVVGYRYKSFGHADNIVTSRPEFDGIFTFDIYDNNRVTVFSDDDIEVLYTGTLTGPDNSKQLEGTLLSGNKFRALFNLITGAVSNIVIEDSTQRNLLLRPTGSGCKLN